MQIIGHQHQIEAAAGQGPGAAVLEIGADLGQAGGVGLPVGIAVERRDSQAMRQQQPAMPARSRPPDRGPCRPGAISGRKRRIQGEGA